MSFTQHQVAGLLALGMAVFSCSPSGNKTVRSDSGVQELPLVNSTGAESAAKVFLAGSQVKSRSSELLLTFSTNTLGPGQTDAFMKIGWVRILPDGTWNAPEFVLSATVPNQALSVPSIISDATKGDAPSIFTAMEGVPAVAQFTKPSSSGVGFSEPKTIASNIFPGDLQKVVFASTTVPEPYLGALALVREINGNFRVYYSETKDGENWTTATSLSPGGFQQAVDGLDPSRSALQLEFDVNGIPHALFEARGFSGGSGTGHIEAVYGYRSGGGWNFASPTLINSDSNGAPCAKDPPTSEYESPSFRIDGSGSVHIAFICSNAAYYGTNASGIWVKTSLAIGGVSIPVDQTQIELSPSGQPTVMIRKDMSLEVWSKNSGRWSNRPVTATQEVSAATMGFDGSGNVHVVWTRSFSGEESKILHHSRVVGGGTFSAPETMFQHDYPIGLSPYHALVESVK